MIKYNINDKIITIAPYFLEKDVILPGSKGSITNVIDSNNYEININNNIVVMGKHIFRLDITQDSI